MAHDRYLRVQPFLRVRWDFGTDARLEGHMPLRKILAAILLGVSVYFSLGFFHCGENYTYVENDYQAAHGVVYTVIYKYFNGQCVGWTIIAGGAGGGESVSGDSDCSAAVPVVRAMTAVPGGGPGGSPLAGNLRPRATSNSQGILLIADAFTGVDAFDLASSALLATHAGEGKSTGSGIAAGTKHGLRDRKSVV